MAELGSDPLWIWALMRNRTTESNSQPTIAMARYLMTRRGVIRMALILFSLSFALRPMLANQARANGADFYGPIIALFFTIIAGYTLFLGPQMARQDLRNDLPNMDLLKTYPVEGTPAPYDSEST